MVFNQDSSHLYDSRKIFLFMNFFFHFCIFVALMADTSNYDYFDNGQVFWISSQRYRVILKKVLSYIFRIILISKEERISAMESKDRVLSLSKIS